MSEKAPQCLKCIHNIEDGLCYRNNDGRGIAQLTTPCGSRDIFHNCDTCVKTIGKDCQRIKHVGRGICRGDWVINPYFDLSGGKQA